jgi:hypothetical protein
MHCPFGRRCNLQRFGVMTEIRYTPQKIFKSFVGNILPYDYSGWNEQS